MNWLAQVWMERTLNSLPEGLLLALCSWLLLRFVGRQNSGTRFAVWLTALAGVAALSLAGSFRFMGEHVAAPMSRFIPHLTMPVYWAKVAFVLWALVAFTALIRIFVGVVQLAAIKRNCRNIYPSDLGTAIEETFKQHVAKRFVSLAVSEQVKVPAAIGLWKPMIVLPEWTLHELEPLELNPILVHELTHLKRYDDWTNLLQKVVRAIFFFHPAVWWIDARLSLEREMACDDAVLASCSNPRGYASSLIGLLEKSCNRRGWTMVQAAVHRAQELSVRIAQILDTKRPSSTRIGRPALALSGVVLIGCFGLAYSSPQLVAFVPQHRNFAAHASHTENFDMPNLKGEVVPASFHIPVAAPRSLKATTSISKPVKAQKRHQAAVMKDAKLTVVRRTPKEQIFVVMQTSFINSVENPQNTMPAMRMQVWQIVWIVPTLNPAQLESGSSAI